MDFGMVCMWQLMWRCMNTIPIWGHPRGSTWHWLIQGIDQSWGRMVGQEQHQGGALYLHVLGLYLSPGKETLLSLQISAINVTPDAVTFYSPGKQRNCYLNTDFQPPIFDKVFTLCLWLILNISHASPMVSVTRCPTACMPLWWRTSSSTALASHISLTGSLTATRWRMQQAFLLARGRISSACR